MAEIGEISEKDRIDFLEGVHSGIYGPNNIPLNIYLATASILMEEVFSAFGRSFFDPQISIGDLDTLRAFHNNVFLFSGAKTARQAEDLTRALLDDRGFLRPWREFKEIGLEIDRAYNLNWLRTERSTAFALGQSAAQWKDIEAIKDIFTHLKYITKEDSHVRETHRALHGIIRPVDHPFWDTHFPPVDWNCRCTWEQLLKDEVPKRVGRIDKTVEDVPNPLFKYNPGKTGFLFGPNHPYFEALKRYPYLTKLVPPAPTPPVVNVDVKPKIQPSDAHVRYFKRAFTKAPDDTFEDLNLDALRALNAAGGGDIKIKTGSRSALHSYVMPSGESFNHSLVFGLKEGTRSRSWWDNSRNYRSRVVHHEIGHAIHHKAKFLQHGVWDPELERIWESHKARLLADLDTVDLPDLAKLDSRLSKMTKEFYSATGDNAREEIIRIMKKYDFDGSRLPDWWTANDAINDANSARDMIEALVGDTKHYLGAGHGKSYFRGKGKQMAEAMAHTSESYFSKHGPGVWSQALPELHDDLMRYFGEQITKLLDQ